MTARAWSIAAALVIAPLVACVALQLAHADAYAISRGDVATIELRVLQALRLQQWLGPYSRFDVSHPGPLLFYLLAPVYALSGQAAGSMYVAAAGLNLAACVAIVRVCWTRVTGSVHRAALLLGTTALLSVLVDAHAPLALATPWNPFVTIVPFGLLLVLCAAADSRWRGWVIAVIGLHAFVAQTHAMYVLPATAALGLALAWRWSSERRRIEFAIAGAMAAVLWLPTVVDEIAGSHNIRAIAALANDRALGLSTLESVGVLADRVAFGSALLLVFLVVMLSWARVRLRHEPSSFRTRLVVLAIVQLAIATLVIAKLDAPRGYLTAWISIVAFVAWLAAALAWLPSELRRARWLPLACATIAACVGGFYQLEVMTHRMQKLADAKPARSDDVLRLVAEFEALAPEGALLVSRAPQRWHVFAALALQLHKRGIPFAVEPKWQHMLGEGITTATAAEHTIDLLERDGVVVLQPEPDRRVHATIVDALGVEGDLALLLDGDAPADGTKPTHANAVLLTDGFITLHLDGNAERLELTAIGDDWFRIEGSYDGITFEQLALTPRAGPGLRTRTLDLPPPDIRPWPYLRITPHDGPWPFWLAELKPLGREAL